MLRHGHFLALLVIVVSLFSFSFFITDAFAQYYYGTLTLDPIPSEVKTGDTITFSGQFITTEGYAITGATIYIQDDITLGLDTILGSVVTDQNGKFTATWEALPRSDGGAYDFYAVFEGDSQFSYSRSRTYSVTVGSSSSTSGGTTSTTSGLPSIAGCVPNSYDHFVINLDPIPYSIYAGETITFTGKVTCNGNSLSNVPIHIIEDDFIDQQVLASGYTDGNGKFSIPWKVAAAIFEKDFDIYALHETTTVNGGYWGFQSNEQVMTVVRVAASIQLDPFQKSIDVGKPIIFTGTLKIGHGDVEGLVVYIKDEDPLDPDDLLATAYVNSDGRFSANWLASNVDEDRIADIYAVFEGFETFQRVTTCDIGATNILGGTCAYTIPLQITGFVPPPVTPPPTTTPPITEEPLLGDEYMQLFYSMSFNKRLLVAIVPDPDSYNDVRRHIVPSQDGVNLWTSMLKQKHGGNWNVDFEVVNPGSKFNQKPDVIMNLVTREMDTSCFDWAGYASIRSTPIRPINTVVCADSFRTTTQVQGTAAHEFIHAVGLGHAFNKPGDLMCSVENGKPTCGLSFFNSRTPSDFNLVAVGKIYGKDGFLNPNSQVSYREKFSASDYLNFDSSYVPPTTTTVPTKPTTPTKPIILDSDGDFIPDNFDLCPFVAETYNQYLDNDGCPDTKPTTTTKPPLSIKPTIPTTPTSKTTGLLTMSLFSEGKNYGRSMTVELGKAIQFAGKLTDGKGNPVSSTKVYINDKDNSDFQKLTTTKRDGTYLYYWGSKINDKNFEHERSKWDFIATSQVGSEIVTSEVAKLTLFLPTPSPEKVPGWIKNNAKWWSEGQIGDSDFTGGIQHLIKEKIIDIPDLPERASGTAEEKVPDWVKNNAGWWADGMIGEDDFVNGIKWLVEKGIIKV